MPIATFCDLAEEGNSASRHGKRVLWDEIVERQYAKFGSSAMLAGGQATQAGLKMNMQKSQPCTGGSNQNRIGLALAPESR
jgi:hypothetical protein